LIGAIREALNERNKIFQASQYAQVSFRAILIEVGGATILLARAG